MKSKRKKKMKMMKLKGSINPFKEILAMQKTAKTSLSHKCPFAAKEWQSQKDSNMKKTSLSPMKIKSYVIMPLRKILSPFIKTLNSSYSLKNGHLKSTSIKLRNFPITSVNF